MSARLLLISLGVLASPAVLGAQLVKDINTTVGFLSSYTEDLLKTVDLASGKLVVLDDGVHGEELWITNGTPAGTRFVRDIRPGPESSLITSLTLLNGIAYFWADDGVNGLELWRSDGTPAGTRIVVNIGAGTKGAGGDYLPGRGLIVAGGTLYFVASDSAGAELWRSDGTAGGTWRVKDINPGEPESQISQFFVSGSRLFFGATDSQGYEPWTSDGTTAGTVRIAEIRPGIESSEAWFVAAAGNVVFFTANDGAHGNELWRVNSNGTGATMVADINTSPVGAGNEGSRPDGVFAVGNAVVFTAVTGNQTAETNNLYRAGTTGGVTLISSVPQRASPGNLLMIGNRASFRLRNDVAGTTDIWVTDGTVAGTAKPNVPQGNTFFFSEDATAVGNGEAFFCVPGVFGDVDIWRTDGTVAGTRVYLPAQGPGYQIVWLAWFDGRLYFPASQLSGSTGTELWSTDGTTAGTRLLLDINPGGGGSNPIAIGSIGGKLLFFAYDGATGFEPWSTDGTAAGTLALGNIAAETRTDSSNPTMLGELGPDVVFVANDGVNGRELWASNGTTTGTRIIKDIYPGSSDSGITNAYTLGGALLFGADGADGVGAELWRTDGTAGGTYRLTDVFPGPSSAFTSSYLSGATMNGYFYFIAQDPANYSDLWRTDGTAAGTSMVADIGTGFDSVYIMGAVGSRLLLMRWPSGAEAGTVWSTDGTSAGTFQVSSNVSVQSSLSAIFNGRRCFAARQAGTSDVYCSNGEAGDMVRITDLASLGAQVNGYPHVVNGTLLISGFFTAGGGATFSTNGAPESTAVFVTGSSMSNLPHADFGGGIVYQQIGGNGTTLVYTDGTVAGTRPFLPAGTPYASYAQQPAVLAGSIVFLGSDPQGGVALWRSDGTAAGTRYLTNIDSSTAFGTPPMDFLVHADKLFFAGTRMGIGSELWTLSSQDPNASDDVLRTALGAASVVPVLANDADFDGTLNASSVTILTTPASGTATVNTSTGAITYTPNAGFSGTDLVSYRVADNDGRQSNIAWLTIEVSAAVGAGPGTAPAPTPAPTPTPTPTPPSNPPKSKGGGALGIEVVLLTMLLLAGRLPQRRRRLH